MKYVVYDPADFADLEVKEGDGEPKKWTLAHRVKTLEAEILRLRAEKAELKKAGREVVDWWLRDGMNKFDGAPGAMFNLRAALGDTE